MSFISMGDFTFNYPREVSSYSEIKDFVTFKKNEMNPTMCYLNKFRIKNFLENPEIKKMVDNQHSAKDIEYTDVTKNGFYSFNNEESYLRFDHSSYVPFDFDLNQIDLSAIKSKKCLLRVNAKKNVVYTVRKTRAKNGVPEYIFRTFLLVMYNDDPNDIKAILQSHCCIKELPNISFFKHEIKTGLTSLDEVKEKISDTEVKVDGNKAYSKYAYSDKYGSVASIEYEKDSNGIFRVKKIYWTAEGYNPLPYLLPIDRKLIDPNYDESSTDSEEKAVVSKSNSGNESSICTIV